MTLQAAAGAPPSAVALLETYAQLGLVDRLPELFVDWQRWAVEVLDSHVAYPLLGYFRSSHDNLSWISALGTILDAASLVLTTIEGMPRGEAKLFKRVGTHLVEDIYNLGFRVGGVRAPRPVGLRGRLRPPRARPATGSPRRRGLAGVRGRARDVRPAPRGDGALLGDAGDVVARRPGRPSASRSTSRTTHSPRPGGRPPRSPCLRRRSLPSAGGPTVAVEAGGLRRARRGGRGRRTPARARRAARTGRRRRAR